MHIMFMKKKDLKKIENTVSISIRNILEQQSYGKVDKSEDYKTSNYDETVSNKFKKLVLNLLDYSETLNININENNITVSANDVKRIKNGNAPTSGASNLGMKSLVDENNYLEISITKERFIMAKGYNNRTCYKDPSMYEYFLPILSKKLQEINAANFNNVWDDIMKDSGMIRDNNLLELFKEIE